MAKKKSMSPEEEFAATVEAMPVRGTKQALTRTVKKTSPKAPESEFRTLLRSLPESLQQEVQEVIEPDPTVFSEQEEAKWCIVKIPEGEFPRILILDSLEDMMTKLNEAEGEEASMIPFYGSPMPFTMRDSAGFRYLFLANGQEAARLNDPEMLLVEASFVDTLPKQDDGWLGDPDLAEAAIGDYFYTEAEEEVEALGEEEEEDDDDNDEHEEAPT